MMVVKILGSFFNSKLYVFQNGIKNTGNSLFIIDPH